MKKLSEQVYGLTGNLLPIHLKPKIDELLSSWIIRLAYAHGVRVESFCTELFGRNSNIWNRDIDKSASEKIIHNLVKKTGSTYEQVKNTLLKSYENKLFESLNINGSSKWIIPLSIYHRTRKKPGLMICQECLKDDVEPYYRKTWRLSFATVCTIHKINLIDNCPVCHNTIIPHRIDMNNKLFPKSEIITLCWNCHYDFRTSVEAEIADEKLVCFQRKIENIISNEYVKWDNNENMYSIVFFEGVRAIIIGLNSNNSILRLNELINQLKMDIRKENNLTFENKSLYQRREILRFTEWVLNEWPKEFVNIIKTYNLRYSDLKGDSVNRPSWYEKVLRQECKGAFLPVTNKEISSIIRYVVQIKGKFDLQFARKLSGHDISRKVNHLLPPKVSDNLYERLLMSIDQEIGATQNKKEKLNLFRDKIMFACAYILKLNLCDLSNLTKEKIEKLIPDDEELSFYTVAKDPRQIKSWVKWYIENIRDKILLNNKCEYLFVSFNTKDKLRKSSIGGRFNRAVKIANMQRTIKNYRSWR